MSDDTIQSNIMLGQAWNVATSCVCAKADKFTDPEAIAKTIKLFVPMILADMIQLKSELLDGKGKISPVVHPKEDVKKKISASNRKLLE